MINAQTDQSMGCQCPACRKTLHASDCAVHNAPAYPVGECDCGTQPYPENFIDALKYDVARRDSEPAQQEPVAYMVKAHGMLQRLSRRAYVADELACKYREDDPNAEVLPLYTSQPPQPQQWPVAWYYRFKNKSGWTAWMTTPVGSEKPVNVAFEDMECRPLVFGDTSPPAQQELDLSWLRPESQKQMREWIADGTFMQRALDALQDQERRLMAYEKAPQPAQQELVALLNAIRTEPTEMIHKWRVIDIIQSSPPQGIYYTPPAQQEPVAEVVMAAKPPNASPAWLPFKIVHASLEWLDSVPVGTKLYTSPPAQRKPLTHEQRVDLLAKFEAHKHEWHAPAILIDMVEAAHGIGEKK